jgi:hypothetical protein
VADAGLVGRRHAHARAVVCRGEDGGRLREEQWAADADAEERALSRFPGPVLHPRCRALATPGVRRSVALPLIVHTSLLSTPPLRTAPVPHSCLAAAVDQIQIYHSGQFNNRWFEIDFIQKTRAHTKELFLLRMYRPRRSLLVRCRYHPLQFRFVVAAFLSTRVCA